MAELVVCGPEPMQRWRRPIPLGEVIRLGRAPRSGWPVPWDALISREHAEIQLVGGQLRVHRLDAARNPIYYQEADNSDFLVKAGEQFRIGRTVFQLVSSDFETDSAENLRKVINSLPDLLLEQHVNFRGSHFRILQRELRDSDSIFSRQLVAKFRRVILLETHFGVDAEKPFNMDRFLRAAWERIAQVFELHYDPDSFHPEQIAQALKSEEAAVFCILDVHRFSAEDFHRLRGLGFTQEDHHVLYVGNNSELATMSYPIATPELDDVDAIASMSWNPDESAPIESWSIDKATQLIMDAVNAILHLCREDLSVDEVIMRVLQRVKEYLPDCQTAGIGLFIPGTQTLKQIMWKSLDPDENGFSVFPIKTCLSPEFRSGCICLESHPCHDIISVPIRDCEDTPLGVLRLSVDPHSTDLDMVKILEIVAASLALPIQVSHFRTEIIAIEDLRRRLEIASPIPQDRLEKVRPSIAGYQLADLHEASDNLGGDFLDFVSIGADRVVVIVGDVAGRGISSTRSMEQLLATSRAALHSHKFLADAMAAVNREAYERMGGDRFATLVFAEINAADHDATFVNAGHFAPLLRHVEGDVELLGQVAAGLPIGIAPDSSYEAFSIPFQPGECLLIFTDGVIEAMNSEQTIYGQERIKALLATHPGNPSALVAGIASDIHNFMGNAKLNDDLCLVACSRSM